MDKWFLYKDNREQYVAVAHWVVGRIPQPGKPCFGGWPVSSEVARCWLDRHGGRTIQ